jgi:DNA-binding beta-propeller fold protein YncE
MVAVALVASGWSVRTAAHGDGVDLDGIVARVGQRIPETRDADPRAYRGYLKLGRVLAKKEPKGLEDLVQKIAAVSRECSSRLAADFVLREELDHAIGDTQKALTGMPAEVEALIGSIASESKRSKVERKAIKARDLHIAAEGAERAGDEKFQLKLFRKAARGFAKAEALAQKLSDKQAEPAPLTFRPEPGTIHTAIGTGVAGFNGDGLPARRSTLYWVEEVMFGPDGLLYILDWNNHMLRRREADGTLTRLVGSGTPGDSEGPALATELNHPSAVAFLPDGRVVIAAWHNHKAKVYDASGPAPVVYTVAGGPAGHSGDGGPATDALFALVPGVLVLPDEHPLGGGDLLMTDATAQVVRIVRLATDPIAAENVAGVMVQTGTVDTVFGTTGVQGHDGNGGPASEATLGFSKAQNAESDGRMTLGPDGSIYIVSGVEHVVRRVAPDGTISTVAGTGVGGFSGDGGPATEAQINFPGDVAVAADGTVFISDQFNHCIRRVAPDGVITTIAGKPGTPGYEGDGGPGGESLLHRPSGLELDADGNLYICDKSNSVVRVLASTTPGAIEIPRTPYRLPGASRPALPEKGPTGTIDTYAGTGTAAFSGDGNPARETDFYWPQNITVNPATGLLYITDWNNHRIRRIEADGTVQTVMGVGELGDTDGPALEVRMNHPTDVAFNPKDGELYVASWHTDRIKRLDSSTNTVVTVNKEGGKRTFSGDGGPLSEAELNLPSSVKFDSAGNAFIADEGNRRVRRADAITGIISTIAGTGNPGFSGDGGPGVEAMINLPVGQSAQPAGRICVDETDSILYIADTDNHRVRRLDLLTGIITTIAGNGTAAYGGDGGPATAASLSSPVDVDCDAEGNLYICDRDNHAVRRVDAETGIITTVAGTGTSGYTGDRNEANKAELSLPCGIFLDRATGRLYIADTFNSVIRVVWE